MDAQIDVLNERYNPQNELIIEHCSGHAGEHSDRALELLDDHDCSGGEWVTIVDGEVVSEGEFTAHIVHVTDD